LHLLLLLLLLTLYHLFLIDLVYHVIFLLLEHLLLLHKVRILLGCNLLLLMEGLPRLFLEWLLFLAGRVGPLTVLDGGFRFERLILGQVLR